MMKRNGHYNQQFIEDGILFFRSFLSFLVKKTHNKYKNKIAINLKLKLSIHENGSFTEISFWSKVILVCLAFFFSKQQGIDWKIHKNKNFSGRLDPDFFFKNFFRLHI